MKNLRVAMLGAVIIAISPFAATPSAAAENDKQVTAEATKEEVRPATNAPADTAVPPIANAGNVEIQSRAQEFIKKVPKDFLLNSKASPRVSAKNPGGGTIMLEEIQVFGKFDPADYVAPKPAPMLVFRASLDQQRPMTPKEVSQTILSFLGVFREFGANGRVVTDLSPEERAEDRLNTPFTPRFGRGTLQ
jgi:hypothetical protein